MKGAGDCGGRDDSWLIRRRSQWTTIEPALDHFAALTLSCAIALSCSSKNEPASSSSSDQAKPSPPPAAGATAAAETIKPARMPPRQFVAFWVETQNLGDRTSYEALYGAEFVGIKRSGSKTSSYDRPAWLKDRARMFGKRMRVEIANLVEEENGDGVAVTFTQVWASGNYKDRGTKRLQLAKSAAGLEIVGEEMLTSERLPVAKSSDSRDPLEVFLVVGNPPVIVTGMAAPSTAAEGIPILLTMGSGGEDLYVAGRKLKDSYVDAAAREWPGRRVRVYGEQGVLCTATVAGLYSASVVWPDSRAGHFMYAKDDPRETAKRAWEFVVESTEGMVHQQIEIDNARQTLASLDLKSGQTCEGGLWAEDASRPQPELLRRKAAPAELELEAKRAIPRLKGYDRAWKQADNLTWTIQLLVAADGSEFLVAGLVANANPCSESDTGGSITAIWKVTTQQGTRHLARWTGPERGEPAPIAGFIAVDGEPRFISALADKNDAAIWAPIGAIHRPVAHLGAFIVSDAEVADCPDL